jgi:hypothetical protein
MTGSGCRLTLMAGEALVLRASRAAAPIDLCVYLSAFAV